MGDKKKEKHTYPLQTILDVPNPDLSKRLRYAKDMLVNLVGGAEKPKPKALDRDRELDCCHSLQRHSRCDAAGARTTFDVPKTLSPSLLPWLADTASAVRSSYFFSIRFFAGASTHSSWPLGQVAFRRFPSSNSVRGTFSKVKSKTPDLSFCFLFFF